MLRLGEMFAVQRREVRVVHDLLARAHWELLAREKCRDYHGRRGMVVTTRLSSITPPATCHSLGSFSMGSMRRLHAAAWGAATIAMLVLWLRSYWTERPAELALLTGGVSFKSVAGRVTTCVDFGWDWPSWLELGAWPYTHSAGFGVTSICNWLFVTTPHWLPVLLCATATIYLAGPARRFNLRTLLILTTVVAMLLGGWAAFEPTVAPDGVFW
jgi:hypothetical protein